MKTIHDAVTAAARPSRRQWLHGASAAVLGVTSPWSLAQAAWPSGPLKFVVPYPAGGNADAVARLVASRVQASTGQTVVIDNRAGAGGTIGTAAVAKMPPDGNTFLLAPMGVVVITPHLRKLPYDALADLVPVAMMSGSFGIVTARKDLPASNMAEFAALAKKEAGKLTFGSAGNATATHITGEIVHRAMGVKLTHIPYKGSAEAMNDLLAGRIDVIYDAVGLPQVKAGALKALAVTSTVRHPELPQVPTLAEQKIDVPAGSWFGVFAPKGTAGDIVTRLAVEVQKALGGAEAREGLARMSQYPDYKGPESFARTVQADHAMFRDLILQIGIKGE